MYIYIVESEIKEVYRINEEDIRLGIGSGKSEVNGVNIYLEILIYHI